jgi:hypothetical protein
VDDLQAIDDGSGLLIPKGILKVFSLCRGIRVYVVENMKNEVR